MSKRTMTLALMGIVAAVVLTRAAGAAGAVASTQALAGPSATTQPAATQPAATAERATVQEMVQAEVARQLPGLVQKEVARQLALMHEEAQRAEAARMAEARHARRWSEVVSTLQTVRSQLELYKVQHEDQWPTLAQMADWSVLTEKTGQDGIVRPNAAFGPYLQNPPASPFTEKSAVAAPDAATVEVGWTYDETTGEIRVVVPEKESAETPPDKRGDCGAADITVVKAKAARAP